jgi:predicted DNA-binding transcriptional regulator AlpA
MDDNDEKGGGQSQPPNGKLLYSVRDVIEKTGFSRASINKMIKNETLKSFRLCGRRLFKASYIDALFK